MEKLNCADMFKGSVAVHERDKRWRMMLIKEPGDLNWPEVNMLIQTVRVIVTAFYSISADICLKMTLQTTSNRTRKN